MMQRLLYVGFFSLFATLLTACASTNVPLETRLALPANQPVFVYFYTDT